MNFVKYVAAAVLLAPGCSPKTTEESKLTLTPCAIEGAPEEALCGVLSVPENWDDPSGRSISLNIVVAPASEKSDAAPLFDFAGGPGIAASGEAAFYLTDGAALRQTRDIVLVDQRGTGASAPLHCPELEAASPLTPMYPAQWVEKCRDALSAQHDLTRYGTRDAARDIDAVRAALGAEQIDIFSLSYGTKLAQAYMRAFPGRVRAAVLVGAAPIDLKTPLYHAPNAEQALRLIFADCARDERCAAAYPDIEEDWASVLRRFSEGPINMETLSGPIAVEKGPFAEAFRALLTAEIGQRMAPRLIHSAAGGDFSPFVETVAQFTGAGLAEGLYLSVECAEGASRIDPSSIDAETRNTFLGRYRVDEQLGACALWPQANIGDSFFEPVSSNVPALFIAGGRDHVTPKEWAADIAAGFSNARVVIIEEMGHLPLAISNFECLDGMLLKFYESADPGEVDSACVSGMKAPPFVVE